MFTGIIKDKGHVSSITDTGGGKKIWIRTGLPLVGTEIGASICCSGCCLTVVDKSVDTFLVDVSNETLDVTTLSSWTKDLNVNIEPSLKVGDELGGHIVSGHVDGLAMLETLKQDGDSWRLKLRAPDHLKKFIAPKGSVALDGISLTVNEVEDDLFGVNIIPHTWQVTTLSDCKEGDHLNLEVDLMARYAARLAEVS